MNGIARAALAATCLALLVGCGGAPKEPDPAVEERLAQFERDNGVNADSWGGVVTSREVRDRAVWVETTLGTSDAAREVAKGICGTWAQYYFVDESVGVVYVRAGSSERLAKCGPKA